MFLRAYGLVFFLNYDVLLWLFSSGIYHKLVLKWNSFSNSEERSIDTV